MAIGDNAKNRVRRNQRQIADPRSLWRKDLHTDNIPNLTPLQKDQLAMLCHQIAFFSDRLQKVLMLGPDILRRKHGNDYKMPNPAKDLEKLISLTCQIQSLHEDILYNNPEPPTQ